MWAFRLEESSHGLSGQDFIYSAEKTSLWNEANSLEFVQRPTTLQPSSSAMSYLPQSRLNHDLCNLPLIKPFSIVGCPTLLDTHEGVIAMGIIMNMPGHLTTSSAGLCLKFTVRECGSKRWDDVIAAIETLT